MANEVTRDPDRVICYDDGDEDYVISFEWFDGKHHKIIEINLNNKEVESINFDNGKIVLRKMLLDNKGI